MFYKIFSNLRINNIKHCLFYIGEESGTDYEDIILKVQDINNPQNLKKNLDDIYINCELKKIIKSLNIIKNKFCDVLESFGNKLIKILLSNETNIIELCKSFKLSEKDFITITVLSTDKVNINNINEKYICTFKTLNSKEETYILNEIKKNSTNLIYFLSNDFDLSLKIQNHRIKNVYFLPIITNSQQFFEPIRKSLSKDIIKNIYDKPPNFNKNSFESEGILNYERLLKKIKTELNFNIDEDKMKNLLTLTLQTEEKEKYFNDICENIKSLENMVNCDIQKNIENLKKRYEQKLILLEENLKASTFYDFLYYYIIPKLRYNAAVELYLKNEEKEEGIDKKEEEEKEEEEE